MTFEHDQCIAQYGLGECLVQNLSFEFGVVTFNELTFELTLADETNENGYIPLVLAYEAMSGFKITDDSLLRMYAPADVVRQWAGSNGLAVDLAEEAHAVILLTMGEDNLQELKAHVAPIIAANRRARSSSRWSATDLLPLRPITVELTSQSPPQLHDDLPPSLSDALPMPSTQHADDAGVASQAAPHAEWPQCANPQRASDASNLNNHLVPKIDSHAALLLQTPEEEVVHLPRKGRHCPTPGTASLPSSISVSPSAAPRKKRIRREKSLKKRNTAPTVTPDVADQPFRVAEQSVRDSDDDDMPLGKLIFGPSTCKKGPRISEAALHSEPIPPAAESVVFDFCDISSPHTPKAKAFTSVAPATNKKRNANASSASKKKVKAAMPATDTSKSPSDNANQVRVLPDVQITAPEFQHEPAMVKFSAPSLARTVGFDSTAMSRQLPAQPAVEEDTSALRSLLARGVDEDNLEQFLKTASRLGKRVREAKRQREASAVRPIDMSIVAASAIDLLTNCAVVRDQRRSKFFVHYLSRVREAVSQLDGLTSAVHALAAQQASLAAALTDLDESLQRDASKWDAVEKLDVHAAICSIRETLSASSSR